MLAKVVVFAVAVVTVLSEDHQHYKYQSVQYESPREYRHHPYEHGPVREHQESAPSSEEQYRLPESHGHGNAYSSQSIVHHGQAAAYEESHASHAGHEQPAPAPVYQYVDEQNEEVNTHHAPSAKPKYQIVHYPASVQHEYQTVQVPHHKEPVHYQPGHHYQPEHNYQPESHEGVTYHHEVPPHVPQQAAPHTAPHHEVPVHHHVAESHESHDEPIDYYAYPKYQYEYKVEDPHTGDNKFQHEYRDGDVVKGVYGLHEADGSVRTVEYSSDKHHGFSAIVKHSAPGQHVQIETHHQN